MGYQQSELANLAGVGLGLWVYQRTLTMPSMCKFSTKSSFIIAAFAAFAAYFAYSADLSLDAAGDRPNTVATFLTIATFERKQRQSNSDCKLHSEIEECEETCELTR